MDLVHAVVGFLEGARIHALGVISEDNKVILAAFDQMRGSLAIIDAEGGDGRDILIPLLGNANAMVRCEAAKALHPTRRDLAIPVLQDISLTCLTEAGNTASMFLIFAGEPNRDSDRMAQFHPHRYDDEAYRAALDRVRARARAGTLFG